VPIRELHKRPIRIQEQDN